MSVIEKMTIMGIRSFGPEDHNRQMIEFFRPLTLILGPNGSGKTTIIECLRYMTTGDAPPNSDRGGSFVHDPKFAGEQEVKGQVKLQFRDVVGKKVIVTRSLQVTQTAKKLTLKTLEGSITRTSANGEKRHLSSKCAEIDSEMVGALGVSKAILNSVIFCHQEESNWPLSEGKALKQRFDDIFAATRYIKALEEIRKIRNEKVSTIKVYDAEVESLSKNKQKADEFQKELEKTESRLMATRDTIHEVENKLKPITDKLTEISIKQDAIGKLEGQLDSTQAFIKKCEKDEHSTRASINELFEGSKEDLQTEIKNFGVFMAQKKKKLEKVQLELSSLQKKYNSDQKVKSQLTEELGKFKADHERHMDNVLQRDNKLRVLRSRLGLGEMGLDDDEPLEDSQVANVIKNLRLRNSSTQSEFSNAKKKHESIESRLSDEIQKINIEKAKMQLELKSTNDRISKNKTTIHNINSELRRLDSLADLQDNVEKDLKEAEDDLKTVESLTNEDALRQELTKKQGKKREIDTQICALNEEMKTLQKESKIRFEIDSVTKEINSKQEAVDKVINRHKDSLVHLFETMPKQGIYDKVKKLVDGLNKKIQETNKDLEKQRSNLSSLETTKKFHLNQLSSKKEALNENQNKIFGMCGSQDFEQGFDSLKSHIKELQDEKGALTGSLYLYNQYVEKLKKPRACCPLCTRSFPKEDESKALVDKLQKKLQNVPSKLEEKTKLITEKEKLLTQMLELKPIKDTVASLLETEIPDLEEKLEIVGADIAESNNRISELEEILDNVSSDQKMASSIVPDLILLEQNQRELERLSRRMTSLKTQIGCKDVSRNVQQVSDEQTALLNQMKTLGSDIESIQQKINDYMNQVQSLRSRINDLRSEQNDMNSDMQKKSQLIEQLDSLSKENEKLLEGTKGINAEVSSFSTKLHKCVTEKETATKNKEKELEKLNAKIREEEREAEGIEKISQEIDKYVHENREQKKLDHEDRMKEVTSQLDARREEINKHINLEKEFTKDINSQEGKKRDLEDNMKLIEIIEEIGELNTKCQTLRDKIGGYNITTIRRDLERLTKEERDLRRERDEASGRESGFKDKIKDYKKLLKDDMFKDADTKHKNKFIELRTTQIVIDDLRKYYDALNKAIMSYHQLKMKEINKIIKDLWMQTYAGNDIDFVEIQTDEDQGLEKARRTFNYRVVMVKGDTSTDMRGRCSAGQKVLASLIIRLALAETFCLNCGILALDEPTTNLDRENIQNLALALVEIVKSRTEQRNFQLIIITHDEDFLGLLGKSDCADYFYKVSKNNNAFSTITKSYISQMPI